MTITHRRLIGAGIMLTLVVLRLFVAADRDLLALNAPYDEFWYIQSAARFVWGGEYDHLTFVHLPIYPLWLAAVDLVGVPARLAIEIAWLAASAYLAYALYRATGMLSVSVPAFAVLILHPYTITLFDRALAETIVTVLTSFLVAAAIEIWNVRDEPPNRRRVLATAVFCGGFALAFHARKEGIVLLAPLALIAICSFVQRKTWWKQNERGRLAVSLLVAPVAAVVVLGFAIAILNYARWGVLARHDLASPGYQRAVAALVSIDSGRTPVHVTVTAKARSLAYEASPLFGQLRSYLEGEPGRQVAAQSALYTGVPGEIANGWLYWTLRDAGAAAGWHREGAARADERYAAMADEIERAFSEKRLPLRSGWRIGFVDPDIAKWIASVPRAFVEELALVGHAPAFALAAPDESATAAQFDLFVRMAGRRNTMRQANVAGWIVAPANSSVHLMAGAESLASTVLSGATRADVPGGFPFSVVAAAAIPPTEIQVRTPGGVQGIVKIAALKPGKVIAAEGAAGVTFGIDALSLGSSPTRVDHLLSRVAPDLNRDGILSAGVSLYKYLGWAIWTVSLAALALCVVRGQVQAPAFVLLLACLLAIVARAALLALLDASSWSGQQVRYMLPVVPMFVCMGAAGIWAVATSSRELGPPVVPRPRFNAAAAVAADADAVTSSVNRVEGA